MRIALPWFLLGCLPLAGALGCTSDCSDIGCTNSLLIDLKEAISIDESVHVKIEMGDEVRECDLSTTSTRGCDAVGITPQRDGDQWNELDLIDVEAIDARVTITVGDGETTKEFSPTYEDAAPNGDDCPPHCKVAVIEF